MAVKISFNFSFAGQIWQSAVDPKSQQMVLEVRERDLQEISYYLLNFSTRQLEEFNIKEADWWTTLHVFRYPLLIFEQYHDPQDPTAKGVLIYDFLRNKPIKSKEHFQFTELTTTHIIGHEPGDQSRKLELDLRSLGVSLQENSASKVSYPVYYHPGSQAHQTVMQFLSIESDRLGCEYLEWKNYIIISYYKRLGTKFDRMLLVLEGDREICHLVQDKDMDGYASGAFFIFQELLVYVENGNQINGIEL